MQREQAFNIDRDSAAGCIASVVYYSGYICGAVQKVVCQRSPNYTVSQESKELHHKGRDPQYGRDDKATFRSYQRLPPMTRGIEHESQPTDRTARSQKTRVILFRQPSVPLSSDAYLKSFETSCFSSECIGVLEQTFVNVGSLIQVIDEGPDSWAGIIATSTRSCEAWVEGAKRAKRPNGRIDWSPLSLYVPGISTAEPFESSGLPARLLPTLDPAIRQSPPGSAARLADFIVANTSTSDKPFLFLTGDKTLPELPNRLRAAGRKLTLQQVYETGERPSLRGDLQERFKHENGVEWLAFFAPSSAQMVLDHLEDFGVSLPIAGHYRDSASPLRLAAIGQTTATYLESRGLVVSATAEHPTPAGLLTAIQQAEQ